MAYAAPDNSTTVNILQRMREKFRDVRLELDALSSEYPDFGETLTQSLDVVRQALDRFGGKERDQGLAISFNGGKDACVALYLLVLVLAERDQLELLANKRIPVVYFEKEEFPEIEAFMKEVSNAYGFEYLRYATSYKDGMEDLVDSLGIEGVIMGQRRGDPWTESMEAFTPSTPGWAEFTRINPALEWKFSDVWRFLRGSGLSYCVLYDQGYTSLGERGNTAKNEALRLPDGKYRPAYELAEAQEHLERSPRTSPDGKDSSSWVDVTEDSSHDNVPQQNSVLGECMASREDGDIRGPSAASIESESMATVPEGSLQAKTSLSGACIDRPAPPTHALQATNERGARVQPNTSLRGWMGESLRWLPLTVAIGLLLALGTRRSWLPKGGRGG